MSHKVINDFGDFKSCFCCGEDYPRDMNKCPFCGSKEGSCATPVMRSLKKREDTIVKEEVFKF